LQSYNLIRRQNEADLYCAVPEDVPVPPFVTDERWEWAQSLDVSQISGFDAKAAEISANRNASISSILPIHRAVQGRQAMPAPSPGVAPHPGDVSDGPCCRL
jgi:hypothetical protein